MKGIILCGGKGSRLYPLTIAIHKGLLPIYDKPMIYHSIDKLIEAGINDIAIISTREFLPIYIKLLGNGEKFGISLSYLVEEEPQGTAKSLEIAKDFIKGDDICLIYVDNLFLGELRNSLNQAKKKYR